MAIGPSPGNGRIWQRGPWTLGVWNQTEGQGIGDTTVLGHMEAGTWLIDATIAANGGDGGWQDVINHKTNGLIGTYWVTQAIPRINATVENLFPLNPYIGVPIQNTDPYSKDRYNALIAQYTKATPDGLLAQGP